MTRPKQARNSSSIDVSAAKTHTSVQVSGSSAAGLRPPAEVAAAFGLVVLCSLLHRGMIRNELRGREQRGMRVLESELELAQGDVV